MPDSNQIWIGNQTSCAAATVVEPFAYALANGFNAFEWFPDKKPSGAGWQEGDLAPEQRRAIRETAQAQGIRLSVHARLEANPLELGMWPLLLKDVELVRDLGAALLNIHLHAENGLKVYVDSITWLIRHLGGTGLQLAIENTPLHPPEQFNELFARLQDQDPAGNNRVGMCLDLGHANLCAATRNNYLGYLDQLQPQVPIIHLHLHENWGDADSHLPLFTGPAAHDRAGVREFVRRLKRRGFSGSMILEQWPQPPSRLNQARAALLQIWNEPSTAASAAPGTRSAPGKLLMAEALPETTSPQTL
jgi:sugar phosphate isomerase/epimerase